MIDGLIKMDGMAAVARRKLLLFLKPLDDCAVGGSSNAVVHPQVLKHLSSRSRDHQDAIQQCQDILRHKPVEWEAVSRNDVSRPIRDVDMVFTIGGDGTLLRSSHFVDDSVPILGVNSDPSIAEEIEQFSSELDASRSTGFLCAASLDNFEQVSHRAFPLQDRQERKWNCPPVLSLLQWLNILFVYYLFYRFSYTE